jgi:hypothetical protein
MQSRCSDRQNKPLLGPPVGFRRLTQDSLSVPRESLRSSTSRKFPSPGGPAAALLLWFLLRFDCCAAPAGSLLGLGRLNEKRAGEGVCPHTARRCPPSPEPCRPRQEAADAVQHRAGGRQQVRLTLAAVPALASRRGRPYSKTQLAHPNQRGHRRQIQRQSPPHPAAQAGGAHHRWLARRGRRAR